MGDGSLEDRNVKPVPCICDKLNESSKRWIKWSDMAGKEKKKLLDDSNDCEKGQITSYSEIFFKISNFLSFLN